MPDQNFYSNPSQDQGSIPPPPPSQDQQVGIRSMSSDLQSIQQSGGEAPQSQIINAPELSSLKPEQPAPSYQYQAPQAPPQTQASAPIPEMPITENTEIPPKPSFNFKTVLIIVGIIIVAGGLGFGAYYLISNLNSQPQTDLNPAPLTDTNSLPLALPSDSTTSSSTLNTPEVPPAPAPLVHTSLISNPTKTEALVLTDLSLAGFKSAISTSSKEKLVAGNVKDLSFVDANSTAVESSSIIKAFLGASPSSVISVDSVVSFFDRDFTSWFYADKVGGNKFGLVFKANPSVNIDQAKASMVQFIEQNTQGVANLFVSPMNAPTATEFKDGQVEGVAVRFLVFNSKTANVFEYGWMNVGGANYLVMATSYNQMVDIVKRLNVLATSTNNATVPPVSTSTSITSTSSTSTGN